MSTILNFGRDSQGFNAYAPVTASDKWNATLTNGSESHFTIPSNHKVWIAIFSIQPGGDVWVDLTGATATVPSGETFASCTSELNPGTRTVFAGGKISCITSNTSTDIGVMLYAVQD